MEAFKDVLRQLGAAARPFEFISPERVVEGQARAPRSPVAVASRFLRSVARIECGGIEFRHYMDDIFGGLPEAGLSLQGVQEASYFRRSQAHELGSWEHELTFLGGELAIAAKKG